MVGAQVGAADVRGLIAAGTIADTTQAGALSFPRIFCVCLAQPLRSSLAPMPYGMDARHTHCHGAALGGARFECVICLTFICLALGALLRVAWSPSAAHHAVVL